MEPALKIWQEHVTHTQLYHKHLNKHAWLAMIEQSIFDHKF